MSHFVRESVVINGKPLVFETGRLAKQADGAILVTYGESVVLVTAVSGDERPGIDFFPLTCDYVEKTFAAGKIPGGFFKREGRQRDDEILTSRLMDRPLPPALSGGLPQRHAGHRDRPLERQREPHRHPRDDGRERGAAPLSDIPWSGPIAAVRVSRHNGEFIAFPTFEQQATGDIDLVVACSRDAIVMVEGGAAEATEGDVIDALMFAHSTAQPILDLIERIRSAVGKPKRPFEKKVLAADVAARVKDMCDKDILASSLIKEKKARYDGYKASKAKLVEALTAQWADGFAKVEKLVKAEFEERKYHVVREYVLGERKRIDGRDMKTIRPIVCEVGILPRTHGSALFQRGETQAAVAATLGTSSDEQKIDALTGERWKRFILHYNFPPY